MKAMAPEHGGRHDIAARLREWITGGRFMPNERLIEADLAALLEANRANVRMALALLEQEGLVTRERHRGARVRLVTDAEAIEIAEVRQSLETLAAQQAARRASRTDRAALRGIVAAMRKAQSAGDFLRVSQLNADLHGEIHRISGNVTVTRLLETLKSQIVRQQYRAILLPGRAKASVREHAAIVAAICGGDGRAAAKAMHQHIGGVIAALKRAIALKVGAS